MARFKNVIFVAILIFLFVEILIIFPRYLEKTDQEEKRTPAPTEEAPTAEQTMEGVNYVETTNGVRDWEMHAQKAEGYSKKGTWEIKKARLNFYNKEKIDFTLLGNDGLIDMKTKDMKVTGDVRLTSANGYLFLSKEVLYRSQLRQMISPVPITVTTPKDKEGDEMTIQGLEMTVFIDQSRILIRNDIRAFKKLSGAKKFQLTSDAVELSGLNKEIHFTGRVNILYHQTKIEAPSAAFFYTKDNKLKNILFVGGARVSDEDKYALSEEMNLDVLANKFTFTGHPRVYQNNDELTGEQIVFLDGGKKVKVEKIRARVENKKK